MRKLIKRIAFSISEIIKIAQLKTQLLAVGFNSIEKNN
jgi:hypothetical protein